MNDVITDKLVDLLVEDAFDVFEKQGEQACRNLLKHAGISTDQIEPIINILGGKYDNLTKTTQGDQ